ncbi:MAG: S1C family serine protease [bacterium]
MQRVLRILLLPITITAIQFCVFATDLSGQMNAVSDLEEKFRELIVSSQKYVVTVIAKSRIIQLEETVQTRDSSDPVPIIRPVMQKNVGSGLVVDSRGIVLTRRSVVNGMQSISVVLHSGESMDAELLGIDDIKKIAVLKVREMQLPNPSFAHDQGLKLGSWVFVMGNSLGMGPAVSVGLVEGIIDQERVVIGARAWRGCGGAPVFSLSGQVLGILAARMESSEDMGGLTGMVQHDEYVVVPVGSLLPSIASIADRQVQPEAWIGITVDSVPGRSDLFRVTYIHEDSPAAQAGIEVGDQVLSFNDRRILSRGDVGDIVKMIQQSDIDDSVKLELRRGDAVFHTNVSIKLRARAYSAKSSARR